MTNARWQGRARATSVSMSVWLAFGQLLGTGLGTGCEVVGQIGADDLAASTSTSTGSTTSLETGTTEDATKPTMTSGTSASSESSSGEGDTAMLALDLGDAVETTSEGESSSYDGSSTLSPDDVESSSSGTAGGGVAPCCAADMQPGCEDPELEACVCAADEFCCLDMWDEACVDVAVFGGCGAACEDMPIAPEPGDCCVASEDAAGCIDVEVQDCVCATDPYCCAYAWDDVCVDYVEQLDCGACQ